MIVQAISLKKEDTGHEIEVTEVITDARDETQREILDTYFQKWPDAKQITEKPVNYITDISASTVLLTHQLGELDAVYLVENTPELRRFCDTLANIHLNQRKDIEPPEENDPEDPLLPGPEGPSL